MKRGARSKPRLAGLEGRLFAKTGTLTNVGTLAGYLVDQAGREIAFAILANGSNLPGSTVRGAIDGVVRVLAGSRVDLESDLSPGNRKLVMQWDGELHLEWTIQVLQQTHPRDDRDSGNSNPVTSDRAMAQTVLATTGFGGAAHHPPALNLATPRDRATPPEIPSMTAVSGLTLSLRPG